MDHANGTRRLIFLDIDGTLTDPGTNNVPASALEAIRLARANGHLVALCSGRNHGMLLPLLRRGFDGAAASAGGYVLWGDQVLYDCPMTPGQQARAMEVLARGGVFRTIEGRDYAYTDEGIYEFLNPAAAEGANSELLRQRRQLEEELGILPLSRYQGEPLYKILITCRSESQLEEPRRELESEFRFCLQSPQSNVLNGELINRRFSKGTAVERICRHLNFPLEDTVGFGDSMNDLELIETAGLGVCMGNGDPRLKDRADLVCPPFDQDGLLAGFRQCGLI